MEVAASTLIALQRSFSARFNLAMATITPLWPLSAMEIQSTHAAEIYQWLGRVPQMREWVDVKAIDSLKGFQFTITNKDYESTIAVKRKHIQDDMLGMYPMRIAELGERAATHPDKLISAARVAGTTNLAYDGKAFYANDHQEGDSGVQDNLLAGSGTSLAQLTTDFYVAIGTLMSFKDDRGEPLIEASLLSEASAAQFLVTVPPALWGAFDQLLNANVISQTTNTLFKRARLAIDTRLTDANDWYLDYIGGNVKPFINQVREMPRLVSLTDPNSTERVFMQAEFLYGVEERRGVDYGLWQHSVKTVN